MIPELARELISSGTNKANVSALIDAGPPFIWVDWREDDVEIVSECESIVGADLLHAEWEDDKLYLIAKGRCVEVPLTHTHQDRHITLLSINKFLKPEYEIRYVWASHGGDTAGILLLKSADWQLLEDEFGVSRVDFAFLRLRDRPNIFTDSLHPPGKRRWQFWK